MKTFKNHFNNKNTYIDENWEELVDDEDWRVRRAVALQGYGLDKLVNDEDEDVRIAVAEQGYGLDKLVNDRNVYVRAEAQEQLKKTKQL